MTVQLFVDFNAIAANRRLSTLLEFAVDRGLVVPGAMLVVGDEDGNTAKAQVLEVEENGMVRLEIQEGSFVPAPVDRTA
jgi:hypothetical protein